MLQESNDIDESKGQVQTQMDTFTAHSLLLPFCASFMPRLANAGDIDIPNLWVISTRLMSLVY